MIEKRIHRENMQKLLSRLHNEQLSPVMETYLSAILEMQAVKIEPKFEGQVIK